MTGFIIFKFKKYRNQIIFNVKLIITFGSNQMNDIRVTNSLQNDHRSTPRILQKPAPVLILNMGVI